MFLLHDFHPKINHATINKHLRITRDTVTAPGTGLFHPQGPTPSRKTHHAPKKRSICIDMYFSRYLYSTQYYFITNKTPSLGILTLTSCWKNCLGRFFRHTGGYCDVSISGSVRLQPPNISFFHKFGPWHTSNSTRPCRVSFLSSLCPCLFIQVSILDHVNPITPRNIGWYNPG